MKLILFFIIAIFYFSYINFIIVSSIKHEYEPVIHPFLWSCPYKTPNYSYSNSFKSQFKEDYSFYTYYFKNEMNGIYVELGALDGIKYSNTYFYEHFLGWSGILIEGGLKNCYSLLKNQYLRPRSQIVCTAICNKYKYIDFKQGGAVGGINGELPEKWFGMENRTGIKTKCSNIGKILHHFHITHIDFFSLDVEGSEINVIETFDFSIIVHYWVIEFNSKNIQKNEKVRKLLKSNGYIKCNLSLEYANECYEFPEYKFKASNLIEKENEYRSNFGTKCR